MKKLAVPVLGCTLVLTGCSATPYRKGYGDTQLSPTRFQIDTRVNGFSPHIRAEEIALLRASEIACFGKFDTFDVVEKSMLVQGEMTYGFMTVEYKHGTGQFDAKFLIDAMEKKLNAESDCHY